MEVLGVTNTEEEIKYMTKTQWKKYVNEVVPQKSFEFLKDENEKKLKTKQINFKEFGMKELLVQNKTKARSETLDLKVWNV